MWPNDLNKLFFYSYWLNFDLPTYFNLGLLLHVLVILIVIIAYCFRTFWVKVMIITFGLVLAQRMSGAGGVIQYSNSLFKMSNTNIPPDIECVIVGLFQLAGSGLSFILIDKVGRRTLLLISSGLVTICLVLLAIYFHLSNLGIYYFITMRQQ